MSNDTKLFTFVVGSQDDFSCVEALISAYEDIKDTGVNDGFNLSIFHYTLPADTTDSMALLIGKGYAFDADWSAPGTYSFCQVVEEIDE
jgi:hypothetical protein